MCEIKLIKDQVIIFDGDSATNRRAEAGLTDWAYLRMMNWNRFVGKKWRIGKTMVGTYNLYRCRRTLQLYW